MEKGIQNNKLWRPGKLSSRFPVLPAILFISCLQSCTITKKEREFNFNIPAKLQITCKIEAISDDHTVDTTLKKRSTKDSVYFSTEYIANCCGWFEGMKIADTGDTVRVVRTGDNVIDMCDCDCLFEMKVVVEKNYFKTNKKPIMFGGKRIN